MGIRELKGTSWRLQNPRHLDGHQQEQTNQQEQTKLEAPSWGGARRYSSSTISSGLSFRTVRLFNTATLSQRDSESELEDRAPRLNIPKLETGSLKSQPARCLILHRDGRRTLGRTRMTWGRSLRLRPMRPPGQATIAHCRRTQPWPDQAGVDVHLRHTRPRALPSAHCGPHCKSCTGFTVLNPAYQIPDRRGRAQVTRGYTRRSRMNWLIKHTDIHLRIRSLIAEAGRKLRAATRDDRG